MGLFKFFWWGACFRLGICVSKIFSFYSDGILWAYFLGGVIDGGEGGGGVITGWAFAFQNRWVSIWMGYCFGVYKNTTELNSLCITICITISKLSEIMQHQAITLTLVF